MTGLYIVLLNNVIYGVYDNDTDAKRCSDYVAGKMNSTPEIRYFILNKNYWEKSKYTKYNELYDFGTQL